jgi:preprotein translocase subunit Sec63
MPNPTSALPNISFTYLIKAFGSENVQWSRDGKSLSEVMLDGRLRIQEQRLINSRIHAQTINRLQMISIAIPLDIMCNWTSDEYHFDIPGI